MDPLLKKGDWREEVFWNWIMGCVGGMGREVREHWERQKRKKATSLSYVRDGRLRKISPTWKRDSRRPCREVLVPLDGNNKKKEKQMTRSGGRTLAACIEFYRVPFACLS
jgi:hypothetical protein